MFGRNDLTRRRIDTDNYRKDASTAKFSTFLSKAEYTASPRQAFHASILDRTSHGSYAVWRSHLLLIAAIAVFAWVCATSGITQSCMLVILGVMGYIAGHLVDMTCPNSSAGTDQVSLVLWLLLAALVVSGVYQIVKTAEWFGKWVIHVTSSRFALASQALHDVATTAPKMALELFTAVAYRAMWWQAFVCVPLFALFLVLGGVMVGLGVVATPTIALLTAQWDLLLHFIVAIGVFLILVVSGFFLMSLFLLIIFFGVCDRYFGS
eukprot:jgi/Botrbrau1/22496/Bobra.114_2s0022.1